MKKTLAALAVGLLLITAGCTGSVGEAATPESDDKAPVDEQADIESDESADIEADPVFTRPPSVLTPVPPSDLVDGQTQDPVYGIEDNETADEDVPETADEDDTPEWPATGPQPVPHLYVHPSQ